MRRFLLFLAGMTAVITLYAAPAAATTTTTTTTDCVAAANATYRHTFNGEAGTATVTATRPLCAGQTQTFSLVSYTTGAPGSASGQFLYDTARATITATNRSATLKVAVPSCYAQVDAFIGTAVRTETTSTAAPYGTATLGSAGSRSTGALAWYAGGTTTCTAAPAVTYTNACDGTFTATLTNGANATTPAVFLTGNRRIRLSPGRSTSVKVAKGATLTVRDSRFTTHVAQWRTPTTTCATTPSQGAPPIAHPTTTPSASPSPSPATSTSTSNDYTEAPAAYATFPDTPANPSALANTGMSTGSLIAIAIGLLMIGGGITAITYLVRLNRRLA
jgi:hypothetical protein